MFGAKGSSSKDTRTLFLLGVMLLGIIALWGFIRTSYGPRRPSRLPAGANVEVVTPDSETYDALVEQSRREPALRGQPPPEGDPGGTGAGAGEGAAGEGGEEEEGWTPRTGEDIPRIDALKLLVEPDREAERERAKFLPMLEKFKPLDTDAEQLFKIRIGERAAAGDPELVLPAGEDAPMRIASASAEGIELKGDGNGDGVRRKISWDDVSRQDFYDLARKVAVVDGPHADKRHLIYLAHLAGLAGRDDEAAEFRLEAARLHFRLALAERAGSLRPAFELEGVRCVAAGASHKGLSVEGPEGRKRTVAWDAIPAETFYRDLAQVLGDSGDAAELARNSLHLSRLAAALGRTDEADQYAQRAVSLEPRMADELDGVPQVRLNYAILSEHSWEIEDATGAGKAKAANDLASDFPSIFHVVRYLRTLGPERLGRTAKEDPDFPKLLHRPKQHRGRVYKIYGSFIRHYKSIRWTSEPEHLDAGLRDFDFCFVKDRDSQGIYLVSVADDTGKLEKSDLIAVTGVYLRRWPYSLGQGQWNWIPWIVGLETEKVEIPGSKAFYHVVLALVGVFLLAAAVLVVAARRDWQDTRAARERITGRRRSQRDHIRRKVAGAVRAAKESQGAPADAGSAPEKKD